MVCEHLKEIQKNEENIYKLIEMPFSVLKFLIHTCFVQENVWLP